MKHIESALANKRVLCGHVADLLQGLTDEDERTHLALFALQRLTDAVEAEEAGLWEALHLHPDIERRARLIVAALAAEASAEEVTREIKKTSVYADKKLQAVKHAVAAANKEVESLEVPSSHPITALVFWAGDLTPDCTNNLHNRTPAARAAASSGAWTSSATQSSCSSRRCWKYRI
jgi:hypothetical protein